MKLSCWNIQPCVQQQTRCLFVHNSLLIVHYSSISCSFSYTTRVSSTNTTEFKRGCPTHFLANFRAVQVPALIHHGYKHRYKETRQREQISLLSISYTINSHEEFKVVNLSPREIKCRRILFSQVNLSARKTHYTVLY